MKLSEAHDKLSTAAYSDQCLSLSGHNTRVAMMAALVAQGVETIDGAIAALEEIAEFELNKENES